MQIQWSREQSNEYDDVIFRNIVVAVLLGSLWLTGAVKSVMYGWWLVLLVEIIFPPAGFVHGALAWIGLL